MYYCFFMCRVAYCHSYARVHFQGTFSLPLDGELARENNWNWEIELLLSPDAELKKTDLIVATSDSVVLDGCKVWANLATEIIKQKLPSAKVIDLSDED